MTRDEAEKKIARIFAKNKPLSVHVHCPRNKSLLPSSWIEFTVALKFYTVGHLLDPLVWDGFRAFGKISEILEGDYEITRVVHAKSSDGKEQASFLECSDKSLQAQSEDKQSH